MDPIALTLPHGEIQGMDIGRTSRSKGVKLSMKAAAKLESWPTNTLQALLKSTLLLQWEHPKRSKLSENLGTWDGHDFNNLLPQRASENHYIKEKSNTGLLILGAALFSYESLISKSNEDCFHSGFIVTCQLKYCPHSKLFLVGRKVEKRKVCLKPHKYVNHSPENSVRGCECFIDREEVFAGDSGDQ